MKVKEVNDTYVKCFGFSREEMVGHPCAEHPGSESCGINCLGRRILDGEQRASALLQRRRKDGSVVYCDMAVMEEGSISRAAKILHRVPSGITARILQIEEDLDVPLFLREKRRLLPTAKGQTLYGYARRVLALLDEAENSVRGMPSEARRVTFSASFFSVSTLER